jgi:Tfp pilus assembly protein PilE
MKNKRGITFIALLATIAIALIIIFTVVISYENIVNSTKKSEFAREMYLVKKTVLDYEFMNSSYPTKDEINIDLNTLDVISKIQFSDEPGYDTNSVTLSTIDLSKAGVENVVRGTTKYGLSDIYAFSPSTKKIYYILGERIGDNTYYTLTDELYELIDINDVK